jgi:hypothetical protein
MMYDLGLISKLPRICVAQAENANPLYLSYLNNFEHFEPMTARKTLASAIQIGNPVSVRKAIATLQRFDGVVEQASELELAEEVARADRTGMFNCPHTGVALAALRKLVERKVIHANDRVVVISTAHGLKFADQKIAYHAGTLEGIQGTQQNRPVEVSADPKESATRSRVTSSACAFWRADGRGGKKKNKGSPPRSGGASSGFSTLAVHGGEPRPKLGNALATPIMQTATYTFSRYPRAARPFSAPHRARRVRPLRQPDPAHRRAKARGPGGRRGLPALFQRHGGGHDGALRRALA